MQTQSIGDITNLTTQHKQELEKFKDKKERELEKFKADKEHELETFTKGKELELGKKYGYCKGVKGGAEQTYIQPPGVSPFVAPIAAASILGLSCSVAFYQTVGYILAGFFIIVAILVIYNYFKNCGCNVNKTQYNRFNNYDQLSNLHRDKTLHCYNTA